MSQRDSALLKARAWFDAVPVEQAGQDVLASEHQCLENSILALGRHFSRDEGPCFPSTLDFTAADFSSLFNLDVDVNCSSDQYLDQLSLILTTITQVHLPEFIGHMTSALPRYVPALMYLLATAHQNTVKLETSGGLTFVEKHVLHILHQQVYGFADEFYQQTLRDPTHSLGSFCSGGTLGNLTALWALRKNWQDKNGSNYSKLRVYVSELGHYSLRKSMDILGFSDHQLVDISAYDMQNQAVELEAKIAADILQGFEPFVIIGIAGATETGSVDNLSLLSEFALKYGCFFHVDAAWGGAFCFSNALRPVLQGIEKADSVVIDAHKQLYCPIGCGIVLFKSTELSDSIRFQANYIIREGSADLGQFTLEGSRPAVSLVLFSHFQLIGIRGIGVLLESLCDLTRAFAQLIEKSQNFELTSPPTLNILTYRFNPWVQSDCSNQANLFSLNEIVVLIQKRQRALGRSFVSRTRLTRSNSVGDGVQPMDVFRVVLANPRTSLAHCAAVLDEQCGIVESSEQIQALVRNLS